MKKEIIIALSALILSYSWSSYAQEQPSISQDSTEFQQLDEVVIEGKGTLTNKHTKVLSTIDGYLESNNNINMVKRGAYAWEPLINGMATERSIITIDGMRIYGACTDKMDPVTSYVEITNLSKADVQSGQSGSTHGATIAGGIDLVRQHSEFGPAGFKGTLFTGFESNNLQKILGTKLQFAHHKFYTDFDFTFRDAENYYAGKRTKVDYSQFSKYNLSGVVGVRLTDKQTLSGSVIYDRAWNVGYPALPMDVSLAEAIMGSVKYEYHELSKNIDHLEAKIYYNQITHIMDDTKRPVVPIRMDMPGWSKTAGFYTMLMGEKGKHYWKTNISGHYNYSLAEMTMYPNNPNEPDMFMLTWPGVDTYYTGFYAEDKIEWSDNWSSTITLGTGIHDNYLRDTFGYESLKIFYPDVEQNKLRWLKNGGFSTKYIVGRFNQTLGVAYAERAPSVSEGYGFYLFNSFDRYDYVGNPHMKNEKSLEFNASSTLIFPKVLVKLQANYFRLYDYIIGRPDSTLYSMNIGINGVKVYEQFKNADLFNVNFSFSYSIIPSLNLSGKAIYRYGQAGSIKLPQIQPFSYGTTLKFEMKDYVVEAIVEGALKQTSFSPEFGESAAPDYTILSLGASKLFNFSKTNQQLLVKIGVENLFDRYYRTFADWNKIPRMGRNFYVNLVYNFQVKKK